MFYLIIRSLALILLKIFFRLQAFGQDNIPSQGGVILAANHASYLDPPLVAVSCPRMVSFLAKDSLFRNRLFGSFIKALHAFPLKMHGADLRSLRWAIGELNRGAALVVFPEGGRSSDGRLHQPLAGVGLLAVKANVPIVPAFIEGSDRALPVGSKFIRLKKIRVYFAAAIYPQDVKPGADKEHYQALADKTMQAITALKTRQK